MDPQLGEALTRWTIRLAVACYIGRLLVEVGVSRRTKATSTAGKFVRWLWTIGCGLYFVHVLAAFAYFHAWSHAAALRHTADATAAVVGIHWGGGLYINYLFTLFWVTDTILWWLRGLAFPYRFGAYYWTTQAVFAFMVINATVVFGPPYWKWVAVAVAAVLIAVNRLGRNPR